MSPWTMTSALPALSAVPALLLASDSKKCPDSLEQVLEQPSPFTLFPSMQASTPPLQLSFMLLQIWVMPGFIVATASLQSSPTVAPAAVAVQVETVTPAALARPESQKLSPSSSQPLS